MSRQGRKKGPSPLSRFVARLHNPTFLRAVVAGSVLAVGYIAVYAPLGANIDNDEHRIAAQKKRLDTVVEIESLRKEYASFKDRIPQKADTDEWVGYVLSGIRQFPLKLVLLSPNPPKVVGPYKGIVLRMELQGQLSDMNSLLKWLETNERILRVDAMDIETSLQTKGALIMRLTIVGVTA